MCHDEGMANGRRVGANVLRGLFLAAFCVALFDTPAAYVAARGGPWWLSLAVGLATFPILALIWHALGERKRKANPPAKPMTTGWERLLLRGATIGVIVVGALVGIAGPQRVWSAVRHHALWFVPDGSGALTADSKLFDHVPTDADGLVWVRLDDGTRDALATALPKLAEVSEALKVSDFLVAGGKKGFLLAEQGDSELIPWASDMLDNVSAFVKEYAPGSALPKGVRSKAPDGVRYLVNEGWTLPDKRVTPLAKLVERAPADAFAVAVGAKPDEHLAAFVAYARVRHEKLEVAVDAESDRPSDLLRGKAEIDKELAKLADENSCWKRLGTASAAIEGSHLIITASIALEDIRAVAECAK